MKLIRQNFDGIKPPRQVLATFDPNPKKSRTDNLKSWQRTLRGEACANVAADARVERVILSPGKVEAYGQMGLICRYELEAE